MSSSSLHPRPSSAPAPSLSASTEHLNISIQEQNVLDTLEDTDGIVNKLATKEYTFKSLLSSMTLCSLDSYANKRASVYSLKFRASNYFFSSQQQSPAHTALSTDSGQRIDTIDVKENTALRTNTTTAPLDSLYNDLNIQDANVTSSPTTLPDDRSNMGCSFRHNIFTTNAVKRCAGLPLSTPGARIKNTLQLVNGYNMLSETKRPPSSIFRTDDSQGTLLNDKQQGEADSIDFTTHEYYLWCVDQLVKVFVDSPLKSPEVITEIVLVGPLLQEDSYHNLLSYFITEFESSSSVDVNLLRSLVQLIECASYEYLVYKDLIKVATIISERLPKGDTNTNNYTYLLWALSRILDVMATDMVKDLDNNCDFQLISQLLINLKESNNLYVKYQATYAQQALQYALGVAQGEYSKIFRKDPGITTRTPNKSLENVKKYPWYLALQGTALFILGGQLQDFNIVVGHIPFRNDPNFQWGICRQLGEIAVGTLWDISVRQQAVDFLEELYNDTRVLKVHDDVRQWILTILVHITKIEDSTLKDYTISKLAQLKGNRIKELPGAYPLNTFLPQPVVFPLFVKVQNIPEIEYSLYRLRSRRMKEYSQTVYVAPMAKPDPHASDETSFPLMEKVRDFLASDRQVMLILGDAGVGKSSFSKHLEYVLWKEYTFGDRIPLFVNLSGMEKKLENNLISRQLQEFDMTESHNQILSQHRQLVLICDGYDEGQLQCNLHTTNLLNRSGNLDTKMIITCRPQYLGRDYYSKFIPEANGWYSSSAEKLFQECAITSFSKPQIEDFVEQYILLSSRPWAKDDYMDKLESIPKLIDLVSNPFLLILCLEILPDIVSGASDVTQIQMTSVQLYDYFVQHWLEIKKRRLQMVQLEDAKQNAFVSLDNDGFEQNVTKYQSELAAEIFHKQHGAPVVDFTPLKDRITWKMKFFGTDPKYELLRESSLLNQTGSQYRFVHQSMLEYFYSRYIYEPIADEDTSDIHLHPNYKDPLLSILIHRLSQRNLVKNPSIIKFLAERVPLDPDFKQRLLNIVELSKTKEDAAIAAANSMTILVKAKVSFHGEDFKGVRIPGADLSEGQFDSAQFQGADLTDVNFTKCWIRQADFYKAVMKRVCFGEQPCLVLKDESFSCAYSPNGKFFAVGLRSGEIAIYNATNWKLMKTLRSYAQTISSVAFSPCSQFLLSGSRGNIVQLWHCTNGYVKYTLKGHINSVSSVAFSPCGRQAVSGSIDGTARLWDLESGDPLFILSGSSKPIAAVAYSPDGMNIACAYAFGVIRVYDIYTKQETLSKNCLAIYCLAYSPGGSWIVLGHVNGSVNMWNLDTDDFRQLSGGHTGQVSAVVWSSNEQWIASAGEDRTVKLWNAQSGTLVSSFTGHDDFVQDAAFSPSCLQLVSCSNDRTARIWDLNTVDMGLIKDDYSDSIRCVKYSMDGKSVISGNESRDLKVYNATSGKVERTTSCGKHQFRVMAISPNLLQIAITVYYASDRVQLWNLETGLIETILSGHEKDVTTVAFSSCGFQIVTGSEDNTVCVWEARSGKLLRKIDSHTGSVLSVRFSFNGQQIVSTSQDGSIRIWNATTEKSKKFLGKKFEGSYNVVGFSPSGLVSTEDRYFKNNVVIWNQSGKAVSHILKHRTFVSCIEWSHCEQWIAVGCFNEVRLWSRTDVKSYNQQMHVVIIRDFHGYVNSIVWRPNTLEFVTGCTDGSVRAWRLQTTPKGVWLAKMMWSAGNSVLAVTDVKISNAIGISANNQLLLQQRA